MVPKQWTRDEVSELAGFAKKKGYSKSELAGFIGVDPATLSVWLSEKRAKDIPLLSRNALSFIESKLALLPDKVLPLKREKRQRVPKPEDAL